MSFANFHTHCMFCDGHGHPEEYVKKAIELGFISIGFSSHAPLPYGNEWTISDYSKAEEYCRVIRDLKQKYRDKIQIYLGLEVDCFPGLISSDSPEIKSLMLDYTIGSVHFMKKPDSEEYLDIDGSEEEYAEIIRDIFNGDVRSFVHDYYGRIKNMVTEHTPDIVGHLDLIKKNNKGSKYFDENDQWYRHEVFDTLNVIAESDAVLEINTGGISRGYMDTFYPPEWCLTQCRKLGIPVVINSDAHHADNINTYFKEASRALLDAGYTVQRVLFDGVWKDIELKGDEAV